MTSLATAPQPKVAVPIEQMIAAGGRSTIQFGHLFLPRMFRVASPPFHHEMAAALDGPRRLLGFKVFRDAAKTSLVRAYALRRICYCLSNVIMLVSAKQGHAELTISWLRGMIENNKAIAQAFDLRPGNKWTGEHIEIVRPSFAKDDPRRTVHVFAAGLTGQIRGFNIDDYRPDLILLDDGQTEESVGTMEQSAKTSDLAFGGLLNSLAPHLENPQAKMAVLQTPMEHGDIIDMVSKSPLWLTLEYSIFDKRGNSRWPERYSTEQLMLEKADAIRMGKYSRWMREREVTLVKGERMAFDMEKVHITDRLPDIIHDKVIAVDPASSEDRKADNQAIGAVLRSGPDIYVAACHAARGEMPDELGQYFFQYARDWAISKARVESIAYQRVLAWYLTEQMKSRRIWLTIDKVQDKRKKSDRILQALAGVISHGHLYLYAPGGILDPEMQALYDELASYEPGSEIKKDDRVDMLSIAVDGLNNPFEGGEMLEGSLAKAAKWEREQYGLDRDEAYMGGAP